MICCRPKSLYDSTHATLKYHGVILKINRIIP